MYEFLAFYFVTVKSLAVVDSIEQMHKNPAGKKRVSPLQDSCAFGSVAK